MREYLVGISEVVITPPPGLEMAGFSERKGPATGTHDELKAKAIVFDNRNGLKSAICVLDVCGIDGVLTAAVRRRVANHNAISAERLMLATTHTHSGPRMESDNILNQRWRRDLEDLIDETISRADITRRPARIGAAVGTVKDVGGNRRDPTHGPVDRSVTVMRIDDVRSDKIMGIIVNHACHATTLDLKNLLWSADYPGQVCGFVNKNMPDHPIVMFLNGACGDINPGGYSAEDSALGRPIPNRTFERAAKIGEIIGGETIRLAQSIRTSDEFQVLGGNIPIHLPVRDSKLPAEAQSECDTALQALATARERNADQSEIDRLRLESVYAQCAASYARRRFSLPGGELTTELQGIIVGDCAFLGLPGELFNEIGSEIKAKSPFTPTFLVGYANDDAGYFPTVSALEQGGYEVKTSMFGAVAINRLSGWSRLLLQSLKKSVASGDSGVIVAAPAPSPGKPFLQLRPEKSKVESARFPAVDFHMHYSGLRFDPVAAEEAMKKANVRYGVNLIGDSLRGADMAPFELPPPVRDRMILFGGLDFRRLDDADWPDYVQRKLDEDIKRGSRGLKIYKELGLIYRDRIGNLVKPDDERLKPVWQAAAERKLPVLYHIADPLRSFVPIVGDYSQLRAQIKGGLRWKWGAPGYPTREELLASQERLAAANPQTTFVFAHLAALEADLPACADLLKKYSNVYVDTSARLFELGRQPVTARKLFVEHADRILWGTDYSCPNQFGGYSKWFQFLETSDEWFPACEWAGEFNIYGIGLPDDVLRKIYGENAAKLLFISV